jgi:hypothetical protein
MNLDLGGCPGARKRNCVFLLWSIIQLVFCPSSANSFASTTNAASSSTPSSHRHHHRYWNQQTQHQTTTTTSSTILQMVASTPPRGGSTMMSQPASQPPMHLSPSSSTEPGRWTKIRRTIFPIHGKHEVTKFLLLGSMKFFIIMALTLTRDTKDTLIVTQCGAEAIAFLKVGRRLIV